MKEFKYTLLIALIFITLCSQSSSGTPADSVRVYFRQSHIDLDRDYRENGQTLDSIFNKVTADTAAHVKRTVRKVTVTGGASPEGSVRFNEYLSENRAEATFNQFRERGLLNDSLTDFNFLGRDWEGLRLSVLSDPDVPERAEVLNLLNNITENGQAVSHPLTRLKSIGGGWPYIYLYHKHFPALRESHLTVEYNEVPLLLTLPNKKGLIETEREPLFPALETITLPKPKKPWYLAVKTNMLYDALLLPNIGAEYYVGKNWSILADWMYGWWDKDATHYYWRAYGGMIGTRYWFGEKAHTKPLTGHHVGVFAGIVTYDFELGGKGYMGGVPHETLWYRCMHYAGIEYGYSLPVSRRLNIDFSLGVGYMGGKYLEYIPKDGFYQWQSTHRLNWVGPLKVEIALVWLIGRGNYNHEKGGQK